MRVLLISVEYPPRPGGIGVSCRRLATGLRAAGEEVVVVACGDESEVPANCDEVRTEIQDGIAVHWLPPLFTRGAGFVWGLNQILPLVESYRPAIVHSYTPVPAGYLGVRCAAHANVPHVVSNRGADVTQFSLMWPTASKLVYANSDAILSVSSSFRKYVEVLSGRTDTQHVPNSITTEIYNSKRTSPRQSRRRLGLNPDMLTLGTISKFRWKKGLHYLEEVLAYLSGSELGNMQFLLGGIYESEISGRLKAAFECRSSKQRSRRLVIISKPERKQIPMLMSAMNLFVSTSVREGMPNTLLESLACGTPVAATAVDGQIDLLSESDAGVLLHRFDPRVGAKQIEDLLQDRARLESMAGHCRPFIKSKYLQQHEVENIRGIYRRVIAQRRCGGKVSPAKRAA